MRGIEDICPECILFQELPTARASLQLQISGFESLVKKLSIGRPQFILSLGEHETQCPVRTLGKGKFNCEGKVKTEGDMG